MTGSVGRGGGRTRQTKGHLQDYVAVHSSIVILDLDAPTAPEMTAKAAASAKHPGWSWRAGGIIRPPPAGLRE